LVGKVVLESINAARGMSATEQACAAAKSSGQAKRRVKVDVG